MGDKLDIPTGFTPGPWIARSPDTDCDGLQFIAIETDRPVGPGCRLICEVRPDLGDMDDLVAVDQANAALIALAPSMAARIEQLEAEKAELRAMLHKVMPAVCQNVCPQNTEQNWPHDPVCYEAAALLAKVSAK